VALCCGIGPFIDAQPVRTNPTATAAHPCLIVMNTSPHPSEIVLAARLFHRKAASRYY